MREFYTGITDAMEGTPKTYSNVMGVWIHFDARTINDEYESEYNGLSFEKKVKSWGQHEMEGVKDWINVEGSTWDRINSKERRDC